MTEEQYQKIGRVLDIISELDAIIDKFDESNIGVKTTIKNGQEDLIKARAILAEKLILGMDVSYKNY